MLASLFLNNLTWTCILTRDDDKWEEVETFKGITYTWVEVNTSNKEDG